MKLLQTHISRLESNVENLTSAIHLLLAERKDGEGPLLSSTALDGSCALAPEGASLPSSPYKGVVKQESQVSMASSVGTLSRIREIEEEVSTVGPGGSNGGPVGSSDEDTGCHV